MSVPETRPSARPLRVLLTGASGFIGSHVAAQLLEQGHTVAALLRPQSDTRRIAALLPRLTRISGDLRDLAAAEAPLRAFAPEVVLHLAWHGVTAEHRNDPAQFHDNLPQTLALVRLAARAGARAFIGLGSQAEYGPANARLAEDAPTHPTTFYGLVKLWAGLLGGRIAADHGLRFAWLRVFSTYGPGDHPDWLIPYLVRTLRRGERPALTACEQRWDYLYVADAAEAICRAAECEAAAGAFNLGSGRAVELREVVERVRDLIDPGLPLGFGEVAYRADQVMHLEADITRMMTITGWQPRTTLEEGLRRTVGDDV